MITNAAECFSHSRDSKVLFLCVKCCHFGFEGHKFLAFTLYYCIRWKGFVLNKMIFDAPRSIYVCRLPDSIFFLKIVTSCIVGENIEYLAKSHHHFTLTKGFLSKRQLILFSFLSFLSTSTSGVDSI